MKDEIRRIAIRENGPIGSGIPGVVAQKMRRNSIGIEIVPEYYELVRAAVDEVQVCLFEPEPEYEISRPDRSN